jgi:O-antigen/teichoic acid export membrane protein
MTKVKQLAGDTLIYGGGFILSRLLHYVVFNFYLTHKLSEDEFGEYKVFYAILAVVLVLGVFRMDTALFRFGREKKDLVHQFSNTYTISIVFAFLFCGLGIIFSNQLAILYGHSNLGLYVRLILIIAFLDILAFVPFAQLRLERKAGRFTLIKIINVVITIILVFVLFIPESPIVPIENKVIYIFGVNIVASLCVLGLLWPQISIWRWQFSLPEVKTILKYCYPLALVGLFGIINIAAPILIVEWYYGDLGEAGVYGVTMGVAQIMVLFVTGFNYAAEPFFFKEALGEEAKEVYKRIALAFTIAGGVFMMCVVLLLPLIKIFLGKDFHGDLYLLPILLVANLILGIYYNLSVWYKITDKTKFGAYIAFSGMVVLLSINIIFLPIYGKVATAVASLCCFLVMCILCYFWGQKFYKVDYNMKRIIGTVVLCGIGVSTLAYCYTNFSLPVALPINLSVLIVLGAILYFVNEKDIRKMLQK